MEKIRFRNKYSYTKLLLVMFGYPRLELAHFLGLADNDVLSEVEDLRIVGAEKGGDGHFQRRKGEERDDEQNADASAEAVEPRFIELVGAALDDGIP